MFRQAVLVAPIVALLAAAATPAGAAVVASGVVQVDSSEDHTLARTSDGKVLAWGLNERGQLGDGTTVDRARPVEVQGFPVDSPVVDVSAGREHSLAVTADGRVYAWGANGEGEVGDGTRVERRTPTLVTSTLTAGPTADPAGPLPVIVDVEAGGASYARTAGGDVYGWGPNREGQLGIGANETTHVSAARRVRPAKMAVITNAAEVSAGIDHALVRTQTGTVYSMGYAWRGQLGNGWIGDVRTTNPVQVTAFPGIGAATIAQIEAAEETSWARTSDGRVYAWGSGDGGALGVAQGGASSPVPVPGLTGVAEITGGTEFGFARLAGGGVRGWGRGGAAQLGDGVAADRFTPVDLPALAGSTRLAAGRAHALAVDAGGTLRAWGDLTFGQVGNGKIRYVPTAVAVPGVDGIAEAVAGGGFTVARTTGGAVLAWGANDAGVLGNGTTAGRATPRPVVGLSGIVDVATGLPNGRLPDRAAQRHVLAVDGDGDVWAWGRNAYGQLGDGTRTDRFRPVQIDVPGTVVAVAAGGTHSLALTSAGDVYAWGDGAELQTAAGSAPVLTPAKVGGDLPAVTQIEAGSEVSVARTAAGAIWVWGSNRRGQLALGEGSPIEANSAPSEVALPAALAPAGTVAAGGDHVLAAGDGGSVWGWGFTLSSQVREPTAPQIVRSPLRITELDGRTVTRLASGLRHSLALTSSGDVVGWGSNEQHQSGHGVYVYERPFDVPLPVDATAVSAGQTHSLALGADGKVYVWGDAAGGALGFGVPAVVPTPAGEGVAPADPDEPDLTTPSPGPDPGPGPGSDPDPDPAPGPGPTPTTVPVPAPTPAADRAAPQVALAQPACPKRRSRAQCVAFRRTAAAYRKLTGTVNDPSGIARVEVVVAGQAGKRWYAVSGRRLVARNGRTAALATVNRATLRGTTWTVAGLPKLRKGRWFIRVRAVDGAGNASGWVQRTVTIR